MSQIFVSVGISLDGFIAGPNGGPKNPLGDRGSTIHQWMFLQESFRRNLGMASGGETGADNRLLEETLARTGAHVMGKRMFEEGAPNWPEDAPFDTPLFVLTHERREPWERKGGTTFYFVNDGVESALRQARERAGGKDVRVAGGAETIRLCLLTGQVEEFWTISHRCCSAGGVRLFESLDPGKVMADLVDTIGSPHVSHLRSRIAAA